MFLTNYYIFATMVAIAKIKFNNYNNSILEALFRK
jgi:hypothetical protein